MPLPTELFSSMVRVKGIVYSCLSLWSQLVPVRTLKTVSCHCRLNSSSPWSVTGTVSLFLWSQLVPVRTCVLPLPTLSLSRARGGSISIYLSIYICGQCRYVRLPCHCRLRWFKSVSVVEASPVRPNYNRRITQRGLQCKSKFQSRDL